MTNAAFDVAPDAGVVTVADPDDPRLEPYRAVRERDLLGRQGGADGRAGLFVAEGEVVVRILLSDASRFRPVSILATEARARASAAWLADAAARIPVFVASRPAMDGVVGFPIHRGLLALGLRRDPGGIDACLPHGAHPALVLGLVGLANHDNVGAVFRNAAAFGAEAILLDRASCDPLYRKSIRVSVGTALTVPFAHGGSPGEIVEALVRSGFEPVALSPAGAELVDEAAFAPRTALLLGAEGAGLPRELLGRMRGVRIGMAPGIDSLNVAAAAGIALHAVDRARRRAAAHD